MAVEMSAESTAQTIREIEQQEELEMQQEQIEQEQIAEETAAVMEQTPEIEITRDIPQPAAEEQPQEQQRELPDELVQTGSIFGEFREKLSRAGEMSEENADENSGSDKKKVDFSFHTVELSHQSASSLARLEKLFGKK